MTSRRIEFFYDLCSPYSYLAYWRLPGIAKRSAAVVVPRPVSLPRLLQLTGNTLPSDVDAKRDYIRQDLKALSRYYGIPLEWPEAGIPDTSKLMTVLSMLDGKNHDALAQRLFDALWVKGQNLADNDVSDELLGDELLALVDSAEALERLQANTQEAAARGAFGVPSFWVEDQLFFGNERLFLMQTYLNG